MTRHIPAILLETMNVSKITNMKLHYVYHAIQKNNEPKVGSTSQPSIRFKRYSSAILLEAYESAKQCGDREIELNNLYGYKKDGHHYIVMLRKRNYSKERNKKVSIGLKKAWKEGRRKNRDYSYITDEFLKERGNKIKEAWKDPNRASKQARGERCGHTKLTEEDVKNIRKEFKPFVVTYKKLSQKYKVAEITINHIVNNKTWKHVK